MAKRRSFGCGRVLALGLLVGGVLAAGPSAAQGQGPAPLLGQLRSQDAEVRLEAQEAVQSWYDRLVDGLMAIVAEEQPIYAQEGDSKLLAVQLLGHLRAARAVTVLADNITYARRDVDESAPDVVYPCVGALFSIGKPAVEEMAVRLRAPELTDERAVSLYCLVVLFVEGPQGADLLAEAASELEEGSPKRAQIENVVEGIRQRYGPAQQ